MKKIFLTLLLMIVAIGCVSAHDNNTTDIASNDMIVNSVDCSNVTLASSNSDQSIDNFYHVDVNDVVDGNNAKISILINDNGCLGVQKHLDDLKVIVDGQVVPVDLIPSNSISEGYYASFILNNLTSGEHNIVLEFTVSHGYISPNAQLKTDTFTMEKTIYV